MVHQATSIFSTSTVESADSVEGHPWQRGVFALGTYQVTQHEGEGKHDGDAVAEDDEAQASAPPFSRKGTLRLVSSRQSETERLDIRWEHEIGTAAILDMKWLQPRSKLLSVATADSAVSLYRYEDSSAEAGPSRLTQVSRKVLNDKKALCLSMDWSDRTGGYIGSYTDEVPQAIAGIVSQSDGSLAYIPDGLNLETSEHVETWHAHDYEAWIAAFDCWSGGRVAWSGGDDLVLKGWDVRMPVRSAASGNSSGSDSDGESLLERQSTFTCKRGFEGGVTTLQSHHLVEHLWAVGSYDGHVRLFDARKPMQPLSTTNVGGGVWRLKWHPFDADKLLVGCMHDGFKVMRLDALSARASEGRNLAHGSPFVAWDAQDALSRDELTIMTRFDEHESLAYGCDWDRGARQADEEDTVYSCSFYDARLHAWKSPSGDV